MAHTHRHYLGTTRLRDDIRAHPGPVLHRALSFGCGGGRVFPRRPLLPEPVVSHDLPRAGDLRDRDWYSAVGGIGWSAGRRPPGVEGCRASLRLAVAFPDRGSAARVTRDGRTWIPHGPPRGCTMAVGGAAALALSSA